MTILKMPQSYAKGSTRLGRKSAAIPPHSPRPIEGLSIVNMAKDS